MCGNGSTPSSFLNQSFFGQQRYAAIHEQVLAGDERGAGTARKNDAWPFIGGAHGDRAGICVLKQTDQFLVFQNIFRCFVLQTVPGDTVFTRMPRFAPV